MLVAESFPNAVVGSGRLPSEVRRLKDRGAWWLTAKTEDMSLKAMGVVCSKDKALWPFEVAKSVMLLTPVDNGFDVVGDGTLENSIGRDWEELGAQTAQFIDPLKVATQEARVTTLTQQIAWCDL